MTDGVWLAEDGSVACYDSYWVHGGHAGLFFRKDLLLRYLHESAKCIVWPVLMERMYKPRGAYWPRIQVGGYVWMGEDGVLHHKFRSYEPTELQKKWKKDIRLLPWCAPVMRAPALLKMLHPVPFMP